jgi:threonylcarbamoyladenosine tRNA methylthiotransferase MtaB
MPQLPSDVVRDRARRLREKGEAALRRHLDAQVGLTRKVLTEFNGIGHTEHFTPVRLAASVMPGMIFDFTFAGHNGRQLLAA